MEYRQLGRSGLTVSALGLGCNNFGMRIDQEQSAAVVHRALDSGITFFDTAQMYGQGTSERFLGAALGARRSDVVVATKFGARRPDGPDQAPGSRRNIVRECEQSLRRLGTDYIDLYYQHFHDPRTPIEETLGALDDLVRQGKVRYIASSNLAGWQLADADHVAANLGSARFIGSQVEWSLLKRAAEAEIVPACRRFDVGIVPYFPLASGLLTGKYTAGRAFPAGSRMAEVPRLAGDATEENFALIDRLSAVARSLDHTILELAICWLLSRSVVSSVITGATTPEQLSANVDASGWRLGPEEFAAVEEAFASQPRSDDDA
ncbi:aldo/keto reductase [Nocardia vermiculata]|uniref:Aldo/keto reductase n=1 Tax=Nocardia vermiculata TaxID=257274 RepID=A0A846Y200_9NOCA|nr:aldo/keto reductase [Nocardia vermiculata]NKY51288.1 aldo/keto reductase [Nocardia vermiculata]